MPGLRRRELKRRVDVVIVGSGFGGSLMAMVAHQLGCSVILLEQGSHPRMAIGESTTPLSNLYLERLSRSYDLPRLAPLTKWGSWQEAYPEVACGLKRGFSFFQEGAEPLLVAASPHDAIADTHWYRSDVDHFLLREAQGLGVEYYERAQMESVSFTGEAATIKGLAGADAFHFEADFLIDATGPRGFLHRMLGLSESALPGFPATESLYAHFANVGRTEMPGAPYPVDDAAVHYIFPGGWVWVLRFNNGVTSAGVVVLAEKAAELRLREGEAAWFRVLEMLPNLRLQFHSARPLTPFRHLPQVSFRSGTMAGPRWAMLPSAAGFVDPLLSSGFALTLLGIERLAAILSARFDSDKLRTYAQKTDADLLAVSRLVGSLYATMGNFPAFTAVSLLYFAAVSFAETAIRLGKPELAPGFLLDDDPAFGPGARRLIERAHHLHGAEATRLYSEEVVRFIEPWNLGGFGDPARRNAYPVLAEDLFAAAHKLGASTDQIAALLQTCGF